MDEKQCIICGSKAKYDLCYNCFVEKNKIKTERILKEILQDRLTILRVSNIIGKPVKRNNYKTFIGWICENYIKNGKLIVTQNAFALKDFITHDFLQKCIHILL